MLEDRETFVTRYNSRRRFNGQLLGTDPFGFLDVHISGRPVWIVF